MGQVSASTSVSLRVILIDIISVLSYRSFLALDRPSSCIPQLCSSSLHRRNNVLCRRSHRVAHRRPRCHQYQRSLRAATGRRPALRSPDLRRQRKCMYVCVRCKGMLQFNTYGNISHVLFTFVCAGFGGYVSLGLLTNGTIPTCRQRGSFGGMFGCVENFRPSSTPLRLPTASLPS